ncbi:MAG: alpha-L-arabinofuranosidase C-terminal domain-containing protein [Myxococcota bacterium]|nr:alpha-L-arabinofuranosidase C-terminal domain-containing protein [Myxococcota bacterium]
MQLTILHLSTAFEIGEVDPRIFGGFLEHMGRSIYEGVYEPSSPHADEDGFRSDVLEALRGLELTLVRYPGGNFVSGYHWQDGVGERATRPPRLEMAWNSLEPNHFGTDEFMRLCAKLDWQPMMSVNLGTGTPEEARDWVEYCNNPTGTHFANMRANNGREEPYDARLWCLGNEMDGPWQTGHVPADHYAIRAQQAAKMMKDTDPRLEFVACGTAAPVLPTYLEWDRGVLERLGGLAHYISLHRYVDNHADDTEDFLAVTNSIDAQIESVDAVCRYVQARRRSKRRSYLCFDEWNVWYKAGLGTREKEVARAQFAPHLIEEVYNLEDALVVAGFLNSFIRHADVVKVANLAQLVNVIAPILTRGDELLIQSIYDAFSMYSRRKGGTSLRVALEGPGYTGKTNGHAYYIDASAIRDGNRLHVFASNRNTSETAEVEVCIGGAGISQQLSGELLTGPDAKAANSFEEPDRVRARAFDAIKIQSDGRARFELPPLSLAALTLRLE